jgi:hypothetical protein
MHHDFDPDEVNAHKNFAVVRCSELGTIMRMFSGREDLQKRSLPRVLGGVVGKIAFLLQLKKEPHWGLQRVYGQEEADEAVSTSLEESLVQMTRADLEEVLLQSGAAEETNLKELLNEPVGSVVPNNATPLLEGHVSYLLEAVKAYQESSSSHENQAS